MQFLGIFAPHLKQPRLHGHSMDPHRKHLYKCHEFISVKEKKCDYDKMKAEATLVAGKYVNCEINEGTMCGPASSLKTKTVIYPCDSNRCQIPCICQLCINKQTFCKISECHKTCEGSCIECKQDLTDHILFHKAHHHSCKFCLVLFNIFPVMKFVSCCRERYTYKEIYRPSWVFEHFVSDKFPDQIDSLNYSCDKCELTLKSKFKLKRHEQSQHFGLEFKCVICAMQFTRKDNMHVHMKMKHKSVTSGKISSYQCIACSKSFSKKCHLERHKEGGKYYCDLCSRRYCTLKQLQEHNRKFHSSFTCAHCRQCFKDNGNLLRHQRRAMDINGILKINCELCDALFCSNVQLSKHMEDHPRQFFKCSDCDRDFTTRWKHNQHVKRRQSQQCNVCDIKFCSKYALISHTKTIHTHDK